MSTYQTVILHNPFSEDFTHTWDKEPYTVKSGESKHFPKWLAEHLVKHLLDRELNKLGLPTDFSCSDPKNPNLGYSRNTLFNKCIIEEGGAVEGTSLKQEVELLNKKIVEVESEIQTKEVFCDSCDSKGVRHKKDCPKSQKNLEAVNSEFEGLTP
jgi:hypothetical protein